MCWWRWSARSLEAGTPAAALAAIHRGGDLFISNQDPKQSVIDRKETREASVFAAAAAKDPDREKGWKVETMATCFKNCVDDEGLTATKIDISYVYVSSVNVILPMSGRQSRMLIIINVRSTSMQVGILSNLAHYDCTSFCLVFTIYCTQI